MYAEQAHNRCPACLYIEPCCDGAPQPCRVPDRTPAQSGQAGGTGQPAAYHWMRWVQAEYELK